MTTPELLSYCVGYSTGTYVGGWLEEYLLSSFSRVGVIVADDPSVRSAIDALRDRGIGATVVNGTGLSGPKLVIKILCRRRDIITVQKLFAGHANSFVTISDVKSRAGGWFSKKI